MNLKEYLTGKLVYSTYGLNLYFRRLFMSFSNASYKRNAQVTFTRENANENK